MESCRLHNRIYSLSGHFEVRVARGVNPALVDLFGLKRGCRGLFVVKREIVQRPDDYRGYQNNAAHLAQILLPLGPHMAARRLEGRKAVRGQLHDKWSLVGFEVEPAQHSGSQHRHEYAQYI